MARRRRRGIPTGSPVRLVHLARAYVPPAPTPSGHHVATFARPAYSRDEWNQELRIAVDSFQGSRPYVSLRCWKQNPDTGAWWPTQTGLTIRLTEGQDVLKAISTALNLAEVPAIVAKIQGQDRPPIQAGNRPPAPTRTDTTLARASSSQSQPDNRQATPDAAPPWMSPEFIRPNAAPSSNPGFDEDPPF